MKTFNWIFALSALLIGQQAMALNVFVQTWVESHCGGATGAVEAVVTGGVPPYTFQWSNGATTAIITDLGPGTYAVTVEDAVGTIANAQGEVPVSGLVPSGQLHLNAAHCTGGYPMVDLMLYKQTDFGVNIWGTPPFTITGPASVVSATVLPCSGGSTCSGLPNLLRVEMDVPPGSQQVINWEDANGCTGWSQVTMSTEAVWPVVQVYDVQGTCSGGNNGSFSYSVSPLSEQAMTLRIYRSNGTLMSSVPINSGISGGHALLAPGIHILKVVAELNGPFDDELCWDQTAVMIEDLGNSCGNVSGPVFIDGNANCSWQFGENTVPQAIVEFTPGPFYATTGAMGQYSTNLPLGTYDHTVIHPGVQQECPGPFDVSVGNVVRPVGSSSIYPLDAQVTGSSGPARPGFELLYALNFRNNTAANTGAATLTFTFDPVLAFISATPAPSSVVGNTITWNLAGLGAYANTNCQVRMQVPPDIALIGTVLSSTASIATANTDAVLANNSWQVQQVVTAAYDPNDKLARTSTGGSEIYFIDQDIWIDYTIRFQNTGTDTAFLVVITDTLPTTLDPATIEVGAASHAFTWSLLGHGILRFTFPSILLPDSNVNEVASHGFVGFRVRPRLPLLPGNEISNTANIFFDFNPPVITEPSVLVAEFSTGAAANVFDDQLFVFPNPSSDAIVIGGLDENNRVVELRLCAMDGRLLRAQSVKAVGPRMDIMDLASGPYLMQVILDDERIWTTSVIKL